MNRSTKRWAAVAAACLISAALAAVRLAAADPTPPNQLSDDEMKAGWKLLFDGKSFAGWHSFKRDDVRPGWQIKDGTLACVDPHNAGDVVTADKFDWFELSVDYNISEAGNSGIMFHVTNDGPAIWATGPEVQLEDNVKAADPIRCGWLYALYQPPDDPKTRKPLDATKPVGEWNTVRIVVAQPPAKSEVDVNGVKYYDFVWNSDDLKARVAKGKFRSMANFAKFDSGFIGLQGDHGAVAFRNIKIRPVTAETVKFHLIATSSSMRNAKEEVRALTTLEPGAKEKLLGALDEAITQLKFCYKDVFNEDLPYVKPDVDPSDNNNRNLRDAQREVDEAKKQLRAAKGVSDDHRDAAFAALDKAKEGIKDALEAK